MGFRLAHPGLHFLEYRHDQPETNRSRRAVRCRPQLRGGMPQRCRRRGCRRPRRGSPCSRRRSRRLRRGAPHEGQATAQGRRRCRSTARRRSQCADWALIQGILTASLGVATPLTAAAEIGILRAERSRRDSGCGLLGAVGNSRRIGERHAHPGGYSCLREENLTFEESNRARP